MYAALSVVVAATTGTALTLTPAAADGSDWPATNGSIAVNQGDLGISLINPGDPGAAARTLAGSGSQPAWSPTGTRVVSVVGDRLVTQRYDGGDAHALPTPLGDHFPNHPTYAFNGGSVVYTAGNRLELVPADGAYGPSYLLTSTQEPAGVCDFDATAGLGDTVYFARSNGDCDTSSSSIWSFDLDSGALNEVVSDAFAPALSSDDSRLVYASDVDGHSEVFVSDPDGTGARQLTDAGDGNDYSSFSWAPDSSAILAQATAGGAESVVSIDPATGDVTTLAAGDGAPAWQPLRRVYVGRVYGTSAAATNIAASRWTWAPTGKNVPSLATAGSAVVVSNANSTFAALAPALANKKGGPVLTTSAKSLDAGAQAELQRILPKGRTVYVLGGTDIVSSTVSSKLTSLGYKVDRISGSSRFVTSVNIAKAITGAPKYVFLATGEDYHSFLESEAAAGSDGTSSAAVALMTDNSTMTASVYDYLAGVNPKTTRIVTVGTSAQTALLNAYKAHHMAKWPSSFTYYPITGSTNPATSVALAHFWWDGAYTATFVNDSSWSDGVAGYSSMAPYGPVMWASTSALDSPDKTYLLDESAVLEDAVVFGGTSSLSTATVDTIGDSAAVSGSWTLQNYLNGQAPTLRGNSAMARKSTGPAIAATGRGVPVTGARSHPLGRTARVTR